MTMNKPKATTDLPFASAPFLSSVMQIEPQWIDYNGHLNMAYYNVLFDRAVDELWLKLGIGPNYLMARKASTFTAECHVRYLREVRLGDPVQVSIIVAGADEKRIHTFKELRHATEGVVVRDVGEYDAACRYDGKEGRTVSDRYRNADLSTGQCAKRSAAL